METNNPSTTLHLNDVAPDFSARSTSGFITLSGYRGRWLVFFANPANFTPVCTSEIIAFARANAEFKKLNCALLGLSIDSLYSHIAWLCDIEKRFGVKVNFPLVEDSAMVIARAYGMIDDSSESSASVRAIYVIDPEGIIRSIVYYPISVGCSVAELLRLVAALQTADRENATTPEGWLPGDPLIEPAPITFESSDEENGNEAWYFREMCI
ncbi:peroxiredoxin [Pseudochrobactrum sp. HB0163]|uniref:peroxiredoxin n=1 Tax=Pseudochrobactrum sp. HB0163 TaxID=3450708 RepID=UPI003F6DD7DD